MVVRRIASLSLIALLGGIGAAQAGLFDSTPEPAPPVPPSDELVTQIQRDIDEQQYLDASKLLDQALLNAGDNPKLVLLAGELSLANGHYDVALSDFRTVESKPEQRARALEGEGIALSLLGKSDDALTALKLAVKENPSAWRAWNALGSEYDRRHEWSDAEDAYGHAVASPDATPIVLNNRGFSRLCQNRLDEAIADFVGALAKKPDFTAARNNLRLAIGMKGDYSRAMEGSDPSNRAQILNNVGFAALMRGDYAAAKDFFDQAIKAKGTYYSLAASNLQAANSLQDGQPGQPVKPDDAHAGSH